MLVTEPCQYGPAFVKPYLGELFGEDVLGGIDVVTLDLGPIVQFS